MPLDLFALPSLEITDFKENPEAITLYAKAKEPEGVCPVCGSTNQVRKDGKYKRTVLDYPIRNKPTTVIINTFRFECMNPSCPKKGFVPKFEKAIDEKGRITLRLREAIANCDFSKRTFESIATQHFVDKETVRRIFMAKAKVLDRKVMYEPVISLGIDEAHLSDVQRCVLVDGSGKKAKLIDILPDKQKETVLAALANFSQPEKIQFVTCDMYRGYHEAVKEALPYAKLIVDRFHVIKYLEEATESARKEACNVIEGELKKDPLALERWKKTEKNHFWFKKNVNNLTDVQARKLASLCKMYPVFGDIISVKEFFAAIYDCSVREDAERIFHTWSVKVEEFVDDKQYGSVFKSFHELEKMVDRWRDAFFNFFDVHIPVSRTNGPTEAINGVIKVINRNGRGYGFDVLRAKMLYGKGKVTAVPRKGFEPYSPKETYKADFLQFTAYETSFSGNYSEKAIRLIYSLAFELNPELCERFPELLNNIESGDLMILCEYTWSKDPELLDALNEAVSKLDESGNESLIKLGVPVDELRQLANLIIAQINMGEDAEFIQEYN